MLLNGPDNPRNCPFPLGSAAWVHPSLHPKRHVNSIGSAVFAQHTVECPITLQWAATFSAKNCYAYSALSMGKNSPKIATSPWDFVTLLEKDRATAIGNMHKKLGKDRRVVLEICSWTDRLTNTNRRIHTQTCSLQYFATTTAGEVKIFKLVVSH